MAQQDYQSYLDQNPVRAAQESNKASTGGAPWYPAVKPQESAADTANEKPLVTTPPKTSSPAYTNDIISNAAKAQEQYEKILTQSPTTDNPPGNGGGGTYDNSGGSSGGTDYKTTYIDANGNEQTGIIRNGRTLDANGNEIQGGFTVTTADGSHWRRNADGTSTKLTDAEYNQSLNKGGSEQPYGSSFEDEAYQAYGQANSSENPNAVATVYLDPNGKPQKGYIINGTTYTDPNGSNPVPIGSVVQDSSGRAWVKGENGSEMIYSPNEDDYWYYDDFEGRSPISIPVSNNEYRPQNGNDYSGWANGNIGARSAGGYFVYDGKSNIVGHFDSAGGWHPHGAFDDDPSYSQTWEKYGREALAQAGVTFTGNGKDYEGKIMGGYKDKNGWTTQYYPSWTYNEALGKKTPYVYDPFSNIDVDWVMKTGDMSDAEYNAWLNSISESNPNSPNYRETSGGYPAGGVGNSGTYGGTNSQSYPGTPSPQATATSNLIDQIKQSNAEPNQNLEALNNLVEAYGTDTEGLRQRLQDEFGTPDLGAIREMLSQPGAELEFDYGPSDAYKQAEGIYQGVLNGDQPTLEFTTPERNYEDYSPTDYTEQINQIYDKKFTSARTQIENQLAQGELDIDQAIAKVPAIYESGMNDMATQYEMNKRNANEYFAANGLTSGARAQAMLAMNNVYQQNMSAYRLEQANAIQEYEDKRADLRLQAQSAITEAMLQNDAERAQALMSEYQRQDEYNFKFLLQKMDDDFKYWSQECDNAVKKASFEQEQAEFKANSALQIMKMEEDRRAENNRLKLQAAEYAENQRQFTISTGIDLAKMEEQIRQNGINTELTIAELAQKDGQFKINANMNIAELAEKIRQYGIDTDITLAKLAEQQREFDINAAQSAAELEEKKRQFEKNYSLSEREIAQKQQQIDQNYDLSNRELQEKARQADLDYSLALEKLGGTQKKTNVTGNPDYTPPGTTDSGYNTLMNMLTVIESSGNSNSDSAKRIKEQAKSVLRSYGFDVSDDDDLVPALQGAIANIYSKDVVDVKNDLGIYDLANSLLDDPEANDAINDLLDVINAPGYNGDPTSKIEKLASNLGIFEPGTRSPDTEKMIDILEAINRDRK